MAQSVVKIVASPAAKQTARGTLVAVAGRRHRRLAAYGVGRPADIAVAHRTTTATAASREYRIKAAYLYQFGRYIDWPANAFADSQSPFVIGVMEGDPIIADLDQIAEIKKIQDRPIHIQRFASPDDVRACHIVFLSASLSAETQEAIVASGRGAWCAAGGGVPREVPRLGGHDPICR